MQHDTNVTELRGRRALLPTLAGSRAALHACIVASPWNGRSASRCGCDVYVGAGFGRPWRNSPDWTQQPHTHHIYVGRFAVVALLL